MNTNYTEYWKLKKKKFNNIKKQRIIKYDIQQPSETTQNEALTNERMTNTITMTSMFHNVKTCIHSKFNLQRTRHNPRRFNLSNSSEPFTVLYVKSHSWLTIKNY